MSSTLFVSLSPVLSGSTVSELFSQLRVDIRSTDFTFYGSQSSDLSTSQQKYASAIVLTERVDSVETKFVGQLTSALQPGSSVTLCGVQETSTSELSHNLVLSGLVDVSAETAAASSVCKTVVKAKVAGWALGAKAALGGKNKTNAPALPPANKWTLTADEGDEELIDEEDLLTAEDLKRPAPVSADDCEVGAGRKACKNCSCGRAEAEAAAVKLTPEMLENPTSACGSCSLGDAFRCASCPYRGLPAFEQGQKIQLPSNFLTADV